MDHSFAPPRRNGLIFHGLLLVILMGFGGLFFWVSVQQRSGAPLVMYMLLALVLLGPVPIAAYRAYALWQASYTLERDGLRIRWGLRVEDIPLPSIEWVRPANELGFRLGYPLLALPGAILGGRRVEGLGQVEFIAGDYATLLLVATPEKVYAISPADTHGFLRAFRDMIELGSLSPIATFSSRPSAFMERVLADKLARWMLGAGLALTLILFLTVAARISTLRQVSLGYDAARQPMTPGPAESLFLLAVLGGLAYVADLLAGLFFYRMPGRQLLGYILWGASILTPFLLLVGAVLAR